MGVYKKRLKAGDRWLYKKTVRGQKIESPAVYLSKRAAEEAEARAVAEYLATGQLPQHLMTPMASTVPSVKDLLVERTRWVEVHRSERYARDHIAVFRQVLKQVPEWAELPVTDITINMAEAWGEDWAAELLERGKTRNEVNKALRLLQAAWNRPWGTKRKGRDFPVNPFAHVERFSVEKRAKYLPTDEQEAKVKIASEPEFQLAVEVLVGTGARPGEAVELQWVDVRTNMQPYSVALYTRKKRGGSRTPRRVPISEDLAAQLRSWRKQHPETHFVFQQSDSGPDGQPRHRTYWWLRQAQRRACQRSGVISFSPHSWRHLYASRLYQAGVSRSEIQRLLGHENASTTDKYLHEILGLPEPVSRGK
ncbi:MAG: site-specific integrase [Proteobacteria bacterium]|nr:site-specific integrase [Pseudomonadota bacterium]MBU1742216.1 site-specific integrase [Pseudomonadota bacterium]